MMKTKILLFLFTTLLFLFLLLEISLRIFPKFSTAFPVFFELAMIRYSFSKAFTKYSKIKGIQTDDLPMIPPNVEITIKTTSTKYTFKTEDVGIGIGVVDAGIQGEIWGIALGDSFVQCYGVEREDCWVKIIERKISRRIVNMGGAAAGSAQMLHILKYGLKLKPKIILWGIHITDPVDDYIFLTGDDPPLDVINIVSFSRKYKRCADQFLCFDNYLSKISITYNLFKILLSLPRMYEYNMKLEKQYKELVDITVGNLVKAKDMADINGIKFFVVIFPALNDKGYKFKSNIFKSNILRACSKNNIPFVYLDLKDSQYFLKDGHFNMEGNKRAADIILDEMRRQKIF